MHHETLPDDLEAWIHSFLRERGGNTPFSDGLRLAPRNYFGPLSLPLSLVPRICGPEPEMKYRVPADSFETRVGRLRLAFGTGWAVPPLVANFSGGRFELNDGNHRREALAREGVTHFPVVVWTTGEEDRQAFLDRYGTWLSVEKAHAQGLALGRQGVVSALVVGPDGRIFAQRRSPGRKLFPGCWDLVGGHVEPGEGPLQALERELEEETGWVLDRVLGLRKTVDWESPGADGQPRLKREFVLAVSVRGGWDHPRLEAGKVTEGRWFGPADLASLNENRTGTDTYVYDLVREELAR